MIDWGRVWTDFDYWMDHPPKEEPCKTCGYAEPSHLCNPDWEDQQEKIEQLVNIQFELIGVTK